MSAPDHESIARRALVDLLGPAAGDADRDDDLAHDLGLTSLNKVLLVTSVCDEAGIDLGTFTEQDLAGMTTLDGVVAAMDRRAGARA